MLVDGGVDQSERLGVDAERGTSSGVESAIQYEGFTAIFRGKITYARRISWV